MTYYLDSNFRVHMEYEDGYIAWEDTNGLFDGFCKAYIEGYRVIPEGRSWVREDGVVFNGLMMSPALDHSILALAQAQYEETLSEKEDMKAALALLGVTLDE